MFQVPSALDFVEPIVDHFSPFLVWRRMLTPPATGSRFPFNENLAPTEASVGTGLRSKPG